MRDKNFMGKTSARIVLTIDDNGRICNEITGSTLDVLKLTHSLLYTIQSKMNVSKTFLKVIFEEAMRHDLEGKGNVAVVDVKEFLRQVGKDDD